MQVNTKPLRVLIVEDVKDDVTLLLSELKRGGYQVFHTQVDTPAALLHQLLQRTWDIVLCDYSMPKMDGGQALNIVRATSPDIPFIFVSGTLDENTRREVMRAGAQDYIMKNNLRRLVPVIHRELNCRRYPGSLNP